jgi:hypothetical protein
LEWLALKLGVAIVDHLAPSDAPGLIIESLEARHGVQGVTILAAIAELCPREAAEAAGAALERLRRRGLGADLPAGLGEHELEEALMEERDDRDFYAFRLRRPGAQQVEIGHFIVDREEGDGVVCAGNITRPMSEDDASEIMQRIAGEEKARPISPEELADVLRESAAHTTELEGLLEFELGFALLALARPLGIDPATFPPTHNPPRQPSMSPLSQGQFERATARLLAGIEDWIEAANDPDNPVSRNGPAVARAMFEWKWKCADGELGKWTVDDVERFLREEAPQKLGADEQQVADTPLCMAGVFFFLDQKKQLKGDPFRELTARCGELRDS